MNDRQELKNAIAMLQQVWSDLHDEADEAAALNRLLYAVDAMTGGRVRAQDRAISDSEPIYPIEERLRDVANRAKCDGIGWSTFYETECPRCNAMGRVVWHHVTRAVCCGCWWVIENGKAVSQCLTKDEENLMLDLRRARAEYQAKG